MGTNSSTLSIANCQSTDAGDYYCIVTDDNGSNTSSAATVTIVTQPAGPTLNVKTPNIATVCDGTLVNATFNAGTGGVGCADDFRIPFRWWFLGYL